ncbi:MAG: hypothetical protein Q8P20_01790 [bacterium]|nr:hypothetical protein [bacterium]
MRLYELKFEIDGNDKEKIIRAFGLEFFRQYSDTDYFLLSVDSKKEKYKEVDGRTILYALNFNSVTGMFEIDDEELTENFDRIDEVKKRKVSNIIKRTKDVYVWHRSSVRVAFDSIEGLDDKLFCEIYDKDEATVFEAKRKVVELGFTKFIDKTYDEFLKKSFSIVNIILVFIIIIVIGIIAFYIFK